MSGLKFILVVLFSFLGLALFGQQTYYSFTENKGQFPEQVIFSAEIENGIVFFEKDRFTYYFHHADDLHRISNYHANPKVKEHDYSVRSHAYQVVFENSKSAEVTGLALQRGIKSYFKGSDPSKWASACRSYGEIVYKNLYEGIDLRVYANDFLLKYEYIVSPRADPSVIIQKYGSEENFKLAGGRLILNTNAGKITEERPVSFQSENGENYLVKTRYSKTGKRVSYEFPEGYNVDKELVIDPELIFSTYSGSTTDNFGYTAAFDDEGFLYAGSSAFGSGYPITLGAFEETWGEGTVDIALSKVDTTGTFFVWSAFLGGDNDELPHSIMVNEDGELYVLGSTSSENFPSTAGAFATDFGGGSSFLPSGLGVNYTNGSDIIISRISQDGSELLGSTFVGGTGNDGLNFDSELKYNYADEIRGEIQIDEDGNVFVVSSTYSTDFPVSLNAAQQNNNGGQEAVAFLMSPDLANLEWSTYVGGSSNDAGYSLTLDSAGDVIICGGTQSDDFPVSDTAFQNGLAGGDADGFFTKISSDGQIIDYSTFYGSDQYDQLYFIETDETDQLYVFGQTEHQDSEFIFNAEYNTPGGGQIISKFDNSMTELVWSTAFGTGNGEPNISPTAFLVDVCDRIYLSGWGGPTGSGGLNVSGMDVTSDAFDDSSTNGDFYLMVLFDDASDIFYGSFYGGESSNEHVDGGTSRFSRKGQVYQAVCAGCGSNDDFPIAPSDAISSTNNSFNCNLGVFKFDFQIPTTIADFIVPDQICVNQEFAINNQSTFSQTFEWDFGDGSPIENGANPTHIYENPGSYEITLSVTSTETCNAMDSITKEVTIELNNVSTSEDIVLCLGESAEIGIDEFNMNYNYTWSPQEFLSDASAPNPVVTPLEDIDYILSIERGACVDTIFQTVEIDELEYSISNDIILCEGEQVELEIISVDELDVTWSDDPAFSTVLNSNLQDYIINPTVGETQTFYAQIQGEICLETDEVMVTVLSDFILLEDDLTVCLNDTINVSVINPNSDLNYAWTPESVILSGQGSASVQVVLNEELALTVELNENGCELEETITIEVLNSANTVLIAEADPISILNGQSSQLSVNLDGLNYSWEPSGSLSNANTQNPLATPSQTTTYTVSAGEGDCITTSQVTVRVSDFICGGPNIFVPNAFSPNGDGENDVLFAFGQNDLFPLELVFRIYNRWGQKVFETTDFDQGWDGFYNGKLSDPAVFDYYIEVTCPDGEEFFEKGNITLIR